MAADRTPGGSVLAAEMPLLLFHAAGVALGIEAATVEGVFDAGQSRQSGMPCRDLAELLGAAAAPPTAPGKKLLLKGRDARCWLGIDSLDEIVTIPTASLQPLPEPLWYFRGPRLFWGGVVLREKVVLLVDVERLEEPAPALGEALF